MSLPLYLPTTEMICFGDNMSIESPYFNTHPFQQRLDSVFSLTSPTTGLFLIDRPADYPRAALDTPNRVCFVPVTSNNILEALRMLSKYYYNCNQGPTLVLDHATMALFYKVGVMDVKQYVGNNIQVLYNNSGCGAQINRTIPSVPTDTGYNVYTTDPITITKPSGTQSATPNTPSPLVRFTTTNPSSSIRPLYIQQPFMIPDGLLGPGIINTPITPPMTVPTVSVPWFKHAMRSILIREKVIGDGVTHVFESN